MVRAGAGEMKAHQTLKEFRNDRGMTQVEMAKNKRG
jgi:DNA-binding XRE family transcriptional regulator